MKKKKPFNCYSRWVFQNRYFRERKEAAKVRGSWRCGKSRKTFFMTSNFPDGLEVTPQRFIVHLANKKRHQAFLCTFKTLDKIFSRPIFQEFLMTVVSPQKFEGNGVFRSIIRKGPKPGWWILRRRKPESFNYSTLMFLTNFTSCLINRISQWRLCRKLQIFSSRINILRDLNIPQS